jgi:hypothetical protein
VNVVWHYYPCVQVEALRRVKFDCVSDQKGNFSVGQPTIAVTNIKVFVHAQGIPPEQFFLFLPGEGTLSRLSLCDNRFSFGFEAQQDIFGQSSGESKGHEI